MMLLLRFINIIRNRAQAAPGKAIVLNPEDNLRYCMVVVVVVVVLLLLLLRRWRWRRPLAVVLATGNAGRVH